MSVAIKVDHVCKKYGDNIIIPDLTANIKNGEFFTLLGPSGCGKTTLLRMIAGFNSIEAGTISFGDQVINELPTHQRNIGMVFQSYAIFPHLTVRQNVEYGLKIRKLPRDEMKKRVDEMLKLVRIDEYQDRLPERLSGGQQQRVALARAIVIKPDVLLMDEPLSNLDAKLRVKMRVEIRRIQQELGFTAIYVTHDQEECFAISDKVAIMNKGVIEQMDAPSTIYNSPSSSPGSSALKTSLSSRARRAAISSRRTARSSARRIRSRASASRAASARRTCRFDRRGRRGTTPSPAR